MPLCRMLSVTRLWRERRERRLLNDDTGRTPRIQDNVLRYCSSGTVDTFTPTLSDLPLLER